LGRRTFKQTNGKRNWFGWDGNSLVAEGSSGEPKSKFVQPHQPHLGEIPVSTAEVPDCCDRHSIREFLYYEESFVPLALIEASGSYHYETDPNGCPTRLTRKDGLVVWAARYDAWGQTFLLVNDIDNPLRFQGQYEDTETALCYNRYRYFDPCVGMFVGKDPIGLVGGLNIYAYAPNSLGWCDPLGLANCKADVPTYMRYRRQGLSPAEAVRRARLE